MDNHDNISIVNESSLVRNLVGDMLVEFDLLAGMSLLKDVTPIVNSL